MEIITTAAAAASAKSNLNSAKNNLANASYSKSLMASRALQSNGINKEVNIAQLEPGDVFKGEITNMTGHSVTVSLGNGQVLTAALMEQVPINIGNQLYFEVKENDGERITIRPLLDDKFSPQNQTIEKSLQSAGLQINEKNMAVVKGLMDAGMPIDRGSIMKVLQQLVNFPDAGIRTVLDMMRCEIPITQANIQQMEQYQQQTGQLNAQADGVAQQVSATYEQLGQEGSPAQELFRLNQIVVDTFTSDTQTAPQQLLRDTFGMGQAQAEQFYSQGDAVQTDANGQLVANESQQVFLKGVVQMDETGMPVRDANGQLVPDPDFIKQQIEQNPGLTREKVLQSFAQGTYAISPNALFPSEAQAALANQLRTLGMPQEVIRVILDPDNTAEELLKAIRDYMEQNCTADDSTVQQFLSSREYTSLVENVIRHQWKLTPEQVRSPEQVEQLFSRLAEQSGKLAAAGQEFSGAGEQMGRQAQNMNENLQFIQALNDKYTFAQIPLQLQNQDTNSELYVYTNKKALQKDKKEIQVLLHLDMDHLGSTDVHVQLHGKTVTARFYLADNRSVNTVKTHMQQLQEQIEALGLTLSCEAVRRVEKTAQVEDIVEDFLAKDIPNSQQIKRYTFDMRA